MPSKPQSPPFGGYTFASTISSSLFSSQEVVTATRDNMGRKRVLHIPTFPLRVS
jgi:hypothetical protein